MKPNILLTRQLLPEAMEPYFLISSGRTSFMLPVR